MVTIEPFLRETGTSCVMIERSGDEISYKGTARRRSPAFILLSVLALFFVLVLGIYLTIPVKEFKTPAPDPTTQAIHDLQTSLQQAIDQLKVLQQTVSSDQAENKRLSDQVNALAGKLEALQQAFSSAQRAPAAALPIEPPPPKRGVR
jgi:septal ring factor EnvC (AmiA/AmiB activator)